MADYYAEFAEGGFGLIITEGTYPGQAEQVLADGHADLLSIARGALANPDLPRRLASGTPLALFDRSTLSPARDAGERPTSRRNGLSLSLRLTAEGYPARDGSRPEGGPMAPVTHRRIDVDGIEIFYREAGPPNAPVVVLPHGYPCSSFQFRNYMAALGDRWRLVAPDHPGFGHSATPGTDRFAYTFDAYAHYLRRFVDALELPRYAIYLHDYGSQFGLRLAMSAPERVAGLILQNGDIYPEEHGPKYAPLKAFWDDPTPAGRDQVRAAVSEKGFRDEFVGEVPEHQVDQISPDLWALHWSLVQRYDRREHLVTLLADQGSTQAWFPRQQAYLREHRPPTLIAWGPHDGYMPEGAARAYLRDLPDAELHLLDAGHWALETHLDEIVALSRDFLGRVHPA